MEEDERSEASCFLFILSSDEHPEGYQPIQQPTNQFINQIQCNNKQPPPVNEKQNIHPHQPILIIIIPFRLSLRCIFFLDGVFFMVLFLLCLVPRFRWADVFEKNATVCKNLNGCTKLLLFLSKSLVTFFMNLSKPC